MSRSTLQELFADPDFDGLSPLQTLHLLAACAWGDALNEETEALARRCDFDAEWLDADLGVQIGDWARSLVTTAPSSYTDFARVQGWFELVEFVALGLVGAERFGDGIVSAEFRQALESASAELDSCLEDRSDLWLHRTFAHQALAELALTNISPWTFVSSAPTPDAEHLAALDDASLQTVLATWAVGILDDEADALVREAVTTDPTLREHYATYVRGSIPRRITPALHPAWSIDRVASPDDLIKARSKFELPLPHVARGARARVYLGSETPFVLEHPTQGLCPVGEDAQVTLEDDILGKLSVTLEPFEPDIYYLIELADEHLATLDEPTESALAVALGAIELLRRDELAQTVRRIAMSDAEPDWEDGEFLSLAVYLRHRLENRIADWFETEPEIAIEVDLTNLELTLDALDANLEQIDGIAAVKKLDLEPDPEIDELRSWLPTAVFTWWNAHAESALVDDALLHAPGLDVPDDWRTPPSID